ncbi:MAG: MG2 domain-containing protein, partial [Flavobacteriales bacterium]|nr:MG2 domain-containing protein [Flavobacteriales bacterium]
GLVMPFEAVNLKAVDVQVVRIHEQNVAQFLQVNALDGQRELARVGRPVARATVPLNTADAPDPGQWNRYYLDLADHFTAEPGAIYRVELSFGPEHSTYPCPGGQPTAPPARSREEEEAAYDEPRDYWYYDDYDHYYYDDEGRRDDPCAGRYFAGGRSVSRNLLASDLGLIAKRGNDGSVLVAVSDLRTAAPMGGVQLDLLDLQRRSLGTLTTDRHGLATLPATAHKPFLLKAMKGAQRGYLKLDDGSALSVSSFDVGGTAVDRGLKGFIHGERGVWRPGDTLHLTFMLHDEQGRLPDDHPVVLEITDPRGRLDQKHVRTTGVNGLYTFHCATGPDAPTGYWSARVTVGGTTFHKRLRIETIKPNRLRVALDLPEDKPITAGREVAMQVNWLHGAPARGLDTRVTVTMSRGKPDFKGFEGYTFNDLRTYLGEEEQVVHEGPLDQQGRARFPLHVQVGHNPPAVVNTNIVTRVFEVGGDASMDRVSLPYLPYTAYTGVKAPEAHGTWGNLVTDTTYRIDVVALDPAGRPMPGRKLRAQVYKLNWNWWWDGGREGDASYIRSASVDLLQEGEFVTGSDGRLAVPFRVGRPAWGRFAVRVTDPASGHSSAVQLYVDWPGYDGRSRREAPEEAAMLRFNSDREQYNVGDEAVITIPSASGGRALVSIENGSRVLRAEWVELTGTETRHRFPITADMVPNVYAQVTVVQPHAHTMNDLPIRLYGVVPLRVEDPRTRLAPVIKAPQEVRTDEPFRVEVAEQDGRPMTYTLAIVDEGLLDLTRFRTPDPWGHFHAREALGVRTWDLYDQVIGAFGRQLDRILALGGSDEAGAGDAARVDRFKPVVRFVGPFELAKGKKAAHDFTIANYVGSVRVMVVAGDGRGAFGHAEQAMPVRKPLMVLATLPRVLGPGETAHLPVTVFAMDPKVKEVEVRITPNDMLVPDGPAVRTVRFQSIGELVVDFRVKVKEGTGPARVTVQATGAGERASEEIELMVRHPELPATDVQEFVIEAGRSWEGSPEALGMPGTNSAYLEVSSIPPVDLGRRLQYLIGYPHGCLEQTTSTVFPQLYLAGVMELPERFEHEMRANVEAGLRNLGRFQRADGHFNYWPGGDHYDTWTSVYAGHFMVEAARLGHAVPERMKNGWLSAQRKAAREWSARPAEGWTHESVRLAQAYRLYVLALAGQAEAGAMNRLRQDHGLDGTARWLLAAAYAHGGRADAARDLVSALGTTVPAYNDLGGTFGSDLRDEALIADALLRMGDATRAAGVVRRIGRRLSSEQWYSTQSTAFGLMAVARLAEQGGLGQGLHYRITIGG